jgi:hypothetical protein
MKPRPAGTERRPWRLEKSILCGQGSLDLLVMKISGAPSRRARPTGIDRQGDGGIEVPKLVYTCKGSSSSTGSQGTCPPQNLANLASGSAAKTQQSRAEGKSHRQLLLATP